MSSAQYTSASNANVAANDKVLFRVTILEGMSERCCWV